MNIHPDNTSSLVIKDIRSSPSIQSISHPKSKMSSYPSTSLENLESMSSTDLEIYKLELETLRRRILELQNSRSILFRLPGEIRNQIFVLAMYAELSHRREQQPSRHHSHFHEPPFFTLNRQVRIECLGLWYSEVIIWEEYCGVEQGWRELGFEEVRSICGGKSGNGQKKLVTQICYCGLERMREGVEGSRSVCPRKGVVRLRRGEEGGGLKWWVW